MLHEGTVRSLRGRNSPSGRSFLSEDFGGTNVAQSQSMQTPLQVTFRGFAHTAALDQFIRQCAAELEPVAGNRMTSCHVVVAVGHRHAKPVFHARIDLAVPGGVIAVNGQAHDLDAHEDVRVAVRDAFAAARRQVEDWDRLHFGAW